MEDKTNPLDRFTHPDTDRILGRSLGVQQQPEPVNIHTEQVLQPAKSERANSASGDPAALDTEPASIYCAPGDVIVACDRCGASVATERETYDSARRDSAEIVCPVCAAKAADGDRETARTQPDGSA